MKARELVKRGLIYGLGLGIYAYECFIGAIEGLGLNARGFWGEPARPEVPPEHVEHLDEFARARADMWKRASEAFDRWGKMSPAEQVAAIKARDQEWASKSNEKFGKRFDKRGPDRYPVGSHVPQKKETPS